MKTARSATSLFIALTFLGCGSDPGTIESHSSGQCQAITLREGTKATYSFSLHGAAKTSVELEVLSVSDEAFVIREKSPNVDQTVTLSRACNDVILIEERGLSQGRAQLSTEAMVIIYGHSWGIARENDSVPPNITSGGECTVEDLTVGAGTFSVRKCVAIFGAGSDVDRMTDYFLDVRGSEPMPFGGRIQTVLTYNDGTANSVIELEAWNGV